MLTRVEAIKKINMLSAKETPFLMIADFKGDNNQVLRLDELDKEEILYQINNVTNTRVENNLKKSWTKLEKEPESFESYKTKFARVHQEISEGNTYLLNLTCQTPVVGDCSLTDVFYQSKAKYKLWYKDEFVVFSPETFVQITNGEISSFPMKGTIDADLPNAKQLILSNEKEMAEHATIVDLIRNDMSLFAEDVSVVDFRYLDEIKTNHKHLLQVSSKITGQLKSGYQKRLGDIIFSLLPAGSITGAPKSKTVAIITEVEGFERGFYTGVLGYFDGKTFDSGVMIRYIEDQKGQWVYKSGGGIHFLSDAKSEYEEMIDKVYVPVY